MGEDDTGNQCHFFLNGKCVLQFDPLSQRDPFRLARGVVAQYLLGFDRFGVNRCRGLIRKSNVGEPLQRHCWVVGLMNILSEGVEIDLYDPNISGINACYTGRIGLLFSIIFTQCTIMLHPVDKVRKLRTEGSLHLNVKHLWEQIMSSL